MLNTTDNQHRTAATALNRLRAEFGGLPEAPQQAAAGRPQPVKPAASPAAGLSCGQRQWLHELRGVSGAA